MMEEEKREEKGENGMGEEDGGRHKLRTSEGVNGW